MKLDNKTVLFTLTHPTSLLKEDQFYLYSDLLTKDPAEAQKMLDRALVAYYRYARPSSIKKGDSDELILKYGVSTYVMSLITEEAVRRYLVAHNKFVDDLGGAYSTYEEQAKHLRQPDFRIGACHTNDGRVLGGQTLEVKSTSNISFTTWYDNIELYSKKWTLHGADGIYLFTGCWYNREKNTFYQNTGIIYAAYNDQTQRYCPSIAYAEAELKKHLADICDEADIKSQIIDSVF